MVVSDFYMKKKIHIESLLRNVIKIRIKYKKYKDDSLLKNHSICLIKIYIFSYLWVIVVNCYNSVTVEEIK